MKNQRYHAHFTMVLALVASRRTVPVDRQCVRHQVRPEDDSPAPTAHAIIQGDSHSLLLSLFCVTKKSDSKSKAKCLVECRNSVKT